MIKLAYKIMKQKKSISIGMIICIFMLIVLTMTTFMYLDYSFKDLEINLEEKYGNTDIILYNFDDVEIDVDNILLDIKVDNKSEGCVFEAKAGSNIVYIYGLDFDTYPLINDIKIDNFNKAGTNNLYLTEIAQELLGYNHGDPIDIEVGDAEYSFEYTGTINKKSIYEFGNKESIKAYIPIQQIESNMDIHNRNLYFLDIAEGESVARTVEKLKTENPYLSVINVLEHKNLTRKTMTSSFVYAVIFVLLALAAVTWGILFNFSSIILNDFISQIGFYRTLGLSTQKATKIFKYYSLILGMIGLVSGVVIGILAGNLSIFIQYDSFHFQLPTDYSIYTCIIIAIVIPYLTMIIQINKMKDLTAITMLNQYKKNNFDEEKYNSRRSLLIGIGFICLFSLRYLADDYFDGLKLSILNILFVTSILYGIQYISPHILGFISKFLRGKRYVNFFLSFKNVVINKKQVRGLLGTIITVIAFQIGMYSVFHNVRVDSANKFENQYNGDIFINDIYTDEDTIEQKIKEIESIDGVQRLEKGAKQYLQIQGNNIVAYFIDSEDFQTFFNYNFIDGGDSKKIYEAYESDKNNVIIGEGLKLKGDIKTGDVLPLEDVDKVLNLNVIGICDSNEYMGNVVYLNKELYPDIKTNLLTVKFKDGYDKEALYNEIENIMKTGLVIQPSMLSKEVLRDRFKKNAIKNTQYIEYILLFMTTIAIYTVINSINIFVEKRKREYAMLFSLGANRKTLSKNIIIEGLIIITTGLILSLLTGYLITPCFVDVAMFTSGMSKVSMYSFDIKTSLGILLYAFCLFTIMICFKAHEYKNKDYISILKED